MKITKLLLLLSIVVSLLKCTPPERVDLVIHNAKIYTVNDAFDIAEAMAIKDGKIVAIGPENEILNKYKYTATKIIDAEMKPVYPGFIDAHCHFVGYALQLNRVDLVGTNSFEEVIERVIQYSNSNTSEWIIGRGWDQNDWIIKDFPTNEKLDSLFPSTPVFLTRIDGHAAIANSEALRRANINHQTKVEGGIITFLVEKNGKQLLLKNSELSNSIKYSPKPTGVLIDNAVDLVSKHIPPPSNKDLKTALINAQDSLFKVGLTTIDDAGLGKDTINLIDKLHQQNKLKIKVYAMVSANKPNLDYYLEKGPYRTEKLNVCSFKFYADGALGSRGACLIEPYSDITEHNHHGLLIKQQPFFEKYAPLLYSRGFQMNTHCIGDSANRMILKVYANSLKHTNDKRWRIEHSQVIHPSDLKFYKDYNIIPSIQSTHATSDMYWAEERLGPERIKGAYSYKELLLQNGLVALGTDFPVEDISPIKTFFAAVFRKDNKGFPKDGYQMENALTREETLRGMTIWAAISNFEENEKGSLEIGKAADFVILDTDIMEAEENKILNTKITKTFINGENVFSLKK